MGRGQALPALEEGRLWDSAQPQAWSLGPAPHPSDVDRVSSPAGGVAGRVPPEREAGTQPSQHSPSRAWDHNPREPRTTEPSAQKVPFCSLSQFERGPPGPPPRSWGAFCKAMSVHRGAGGRAERILQRAN